ncbi:MAG: glutamate-1-semialdehyde 2,1-aminomutase [Acidimicrobiales bacterium]|nr:glutamate-1-semialdehyde 2,1-aminomutase [Acidimicrobiales bacterium]MDG1875915.1 glutamate-1-semialdehyde 2,1-aminomutase [Acidimicrobiales bacterium]
MTTNESLFERAQAVIPGGVNSPVRAFGSVGGRPYFVERGEGPFVYDVEGKRYIDFVQSYGPSILGHAHPAILAAINDAASRGTSYGAPTENEVRIAEEMCDRVAGMEMVRLVSSGTEAAMSAIRLARGATGRDKIVKFAGNYHGHTDSLLVAGGSGVAQQGLKGSEGVTAGAIADTIVAPYNVVPELDESIAVVCVEPVAANMGLVAPAPGFLEGLRAECDRVGALLLFDEVITGFRLCRGGSAAWFGVQPDVWCFGKVIGGGLPMGAFGASREAMGNLAPLGGVYQAGTLSGNPLATAAGLAALSHLTTDAYEQLTATASRLQEGMLDAFAAAGVSAVLPRVGPLLGLFFTDIEPHDFDSAKAAADNGVYPRFFHGMLDRGIALAPGAYEALFPSLAHGTAEIDATIEAVAEVASTL